MVALDRQEPAGPDPGIEDRGRQLSGQGLEEARPKTV
jgi:hypothetical protein